MSSPRVEDAIRADLAEAISQGIAKSLAEKQERDRKEKEDAEAARLHTQLVKNHMGDILYRKEARKALRQSQGKPARRLSWERNGADFVRAVVRRDGHYLDQSYHVKRHEWPADEVISVKAAMAETSGATGGYTVPQRMASTILTPFLQKSVFRRWGALQMANRSRGLMVPTPDVTTAQAAGVPPLAGGLTFSWGRKAISARRASRNSRWSSSPRTNSPATSPSPGPSSTTAPPSPCGKSSPP